MQDCLSAWSQPLTTPWGPLTLGLQSCQQLMNPTRLAFVGTVAPVPLCLFYYYAGMMRPIGQKTITIDKIFVIDTSQEQRACHTLQGHMEKHQVVQDAEGKEKMWVRDFIEVSVKASRWGKANIPPDLNPLGPPQSLPPRGPGACPANMCQVHALIVPLRFPLPPKAVIHVDVLWADTRATSSWVLCALLCLKSDQATSTSARRASRAPAGGCTSAQELTSRATLTHVPAR